MMNLEIRGAAAKAFRSTAPRIQLEGPAGTGKSLPICAKLHYMASTYPGARIGIVRSQRIDLNATVIPQYMALIGRGHPCFTEKHPRGIDQITYPNGSGWYFGGLDNVDRLMGMELDFIWFNEGTVGVTLADIEKLETRLRGPSRTPYRQVIVDCNPSYPTHFLNTGGFCGEEHRFKSRHQDNPVLHDGKEWTTQGLEYLARLGNLTGATRKRMLDGIWAAVEGAVFDMLDEVRNTVNPSQWPAGYPSLPCILGVDWGIADPFCALAFLIDKESRTVYAINEEYKAGLTAEGMLHGVQRLAHGLDVRTMYYDPSMRNNRQRDRNLVPGPPPIDDFRSLPFPLVPGRNDSRLAGLNKLRSLLAGYGWLLRIDKDRCPNLWMELEGASWHVTKGGIAVEDIAPNLPDHAITAAYYALRTYFEESGDSIDVSLNPFAGSYNFG